MMYTEMKITKNPTVAESNLKHDIMNIFQEICFNSQSSYVLQQQPNETPILVK